MKAGITAPEAAMRGNLSCIFAGCRPSLRRCLEMIKAGNHLSIVIVWVCLPENLTADLSAAAQPYNAFPAAKSLHTDISIEAKRSHKPTAPRHIHARLRATSDNQKLVT